MAMEIEVFEGVTDGVPPLRIRMSPQRVDEGLIDRLKGLLREHPGEAQVFLHLGERQVLRLPDQFCVDTSTVSSASSAAPSAPTRSSCSS